MSLWNHYRVLEVDGLSEWDCNDDVVCICVLYVQKEVPLYSSWSVPVVSIKEVGVGLSQSRRPLLLSSSSLSLSAASPGRCTLVQTVVPVIWGPCVAWYYRTLEDPPPSPNRAAPLRRGCIGWLISSPFVPERPVPHSSVANLQPLLLLVQQHWHAGNEAYKEHSQNWYSQTFQGGNTVSESVYSLVYYLYWIKQSTNHLNEI